MYHLAEVGLFGFILEGILVIFCTFLIIFGCGFIIGLIPMEIVITRIFETETIYHYWPLLTSFVIKSFLTYLVYILIIILLFKAQFSEIFSLKGYLMSLGFSAIPVISGMVFELYQTQKVLKKKNNKCDTKEKT